MCSQFLCLYQTHPLPQATGLWHCSVHLPSAHKVILAFLQAKHSISSLSQKIHIFFTKFVRWISRPLTPLGWITFLQNQTREKQLILLKSFVYNFVMTRWHPTLLGEGLAPSCAQNACGLRVKGFRHRDLLWVTYRPQSQATGTISTGVLLPLARTLELK